MKKIAIALIAVVSCLNTAVFGADKSMSKPFLAKAQNPGTQASALQDLAREQELHVNLMMSIMIQSRVTMTSAFLLKNLITSLI